MTMMTIMVESVGGIVDIVKASAQTGLTKSPRNTRCFFRYGCQRDKLLR